MSSGNERLSQIPFVPPVLKPVKPLFFISKPERPSPSKCGKIAFPLASIRTRPKNRPLNRTEEGRDLISSR